MYVYTYIYIYIYIDFHHSHAVGNETGEARDGCGARGGGKCRGAAGAQAPCRASRAP